MEHYVLGAAVFAKFLLFGLFSASILAVIAGSVIGVISKLYAEE